MTAVFELADLSRQSATPAAELTSVNKWYGRSRVLDDISLRVDRGEIVALVGRSGSGKSTVLRVLSGLAGDHDGERVVLGAPAVAFQEPRLFPWRSVRDNVLYGLTRTKLSKAEALSRVDRALDEVGLADKAQAWPLTLSGGQAQRVSLARALVAEPQLLLLDEPFGALDALTRLSMHQLLLNLWREHEFGVLLVTHDVDEATSLADTILVLDEGRLVHTLRIRNPRKPQGKHDTETENYRGELLAQLGV
ncbi:ABC transporter ATP-binding protein [Mycobacteroides chelonae]